MISVIVPVYNAATYLGEALRSILAQNLPVEVIVVDGGSDDGSQAIAESLMPVQWMRQQGSGLADARNTGLAVARGEFITFLDADDFWATDSLSESLAHLQRHPHCQAVIGHLVRFLQPGTPLPPAYADGWLDRPEPGYTPGALLARRTVLAEVGGFDETLQVGCDSDWFVRLNDTGIAHSVLPHVVLYKRIHGGNLSTQVERYRRELLTVTRRSLQRRGILSTRS